MATTEPTTHEGHLYVAGIAASAGGLEAISQLVSQLPPDIPGLALVVAQHLHSQHASRLADLLQRMTTLPVQTVQQGVPIEAGHIYVAPPGKHVVVHGGHLMLEKPEIPTHPAPAADILFQSLAVAYGSRAIGIVLSGTGKDGLAGSLEIRRHGGTLLVQDLSSARFPGMPASVIEAGLADQALLPEVIGQVLKILLTGAQASPTDPLIRPLRQLIHLLEARTGQPLPQAQFPRLGLLLTQHLQELGCPTLSAYLAQVRQSPSLLNRLQATLHPYSFFQQPEQQEQVITLIGRLAEASPVPAGPLRIWFAGCKQVEDAYTLAVIVDLALRRRHLSREVKIFATHPDTSLTQIARRERSLPLDTLNLGPLPEDLPPDESPESYLRSLRKMILFSPHDPLQHPPFLQTALILVGETQVARNQETQARLLKAFHTALETGGYLFWGSENLPVIQAEGYERMPDLPQVLRKTALHPLRGKAPHAQTALHPEFLPGTLVLARAQAYPHVIITPEGHILSMGEALAPFLTLQPGNMSRDLLQYCHPALLPQLRLLMFKLQQESPFEDGSTALKSRFCRVPEHEGQAHYCRMILAPVSPNQEGDADQYYLIFEHFLPEDLPELPAAPDHAAGGQEQDLRQQMSDAEANQEVLVEELEVSNEELQLVNERLHNANEELQASVEELELTNQELKAAHVAISAAHAALKESQNDLKRSEGKLRNILEHTVQGFILVDRVFRIEEINPAAADILTRLSSLEVDMRRSLLDYFPEDIAPELLQQIKRGFQGEHRQLAWHLPTAQGDTLWLELHLIPVRSQGAAQRLTLSLLDVTAQREAAVSLQHHKDLLQSVFDGGDISMAILDAEGHIVQANEAFGELMGYEVGALQGQSFLLTVPPEEEAAALAHHEAVIQSGAPAQLTCRRVNKAGRVLDVVVSSRCLVHSDQQRFRVASCRDMTAYNRQHNLLQETQRALKTGGWEWDIASDTFLCTDELWHILGIPEAEPITRTSLLEMLTPASRKHLIQAIGTLRREGTPYDLTLPAVHRAGHPMWLRTTGRGLQLQDRTYRIFGSIQDVTAVKAAEALMEKLSLVASRTHNGVIIAGPDGKIDWVNEGFTRLTGYTLEEVAGQRPGDMLQGSGTDPATRAYVGQQLKHHEPAGFEILNYRKNGEPYWCRVEITPLLDERGKLQGFLGIQSDVTESVRHREEISLQRVQLQAVLESTSDHIWSVDQELRLLSFNSAYARMVHQLLGIDIEPGDQLPYAQMPADMRRFWSRAYRKALQGKVLREEFTLLLGGRQHHFEFILHPIREASGAVQGVSIFGRDISERRLAEDRLRQSGANLEALINNTEDIILSVDPQYRLLTFNQAYARQIESRYGVKAQYGDCVLDFLPSERQQVWRALIDNTFAGIPYSEIQEDIFGQKTTYYGLNLNPIVDGKSVIGCTIFSRDISHIKRAEQDLFNSKQLLERLLGNAPVAIFAKNRQGQFTQVNPRFAEHFGRRASQMLGKTLAQLSPDPWVARHAAREEQVIAEKRSMIFYEEVARSQGYAYFQHILFPLFDSQGVVNGIGGITMDITDQRTAEEALRFQADILANVNDSVIVTDLHGRITYFNAGAEQIFGYQAAEVMGKTTEFLYPTPPEQAFDDSLADILVAETTETEFLARHKDGHEVWVMVKASVLTDEKGEQKGFVGVSKDITEKKRTQIALQLSEGHQRALLDTAGVSFFLLDQKGYLLKFNPQARQQILALLGHSLYVGESLQDVLAGQDLVGYQTHMSLALAGEICEGVDEHVLDGGQRVWLSYRYTPVIGQDGCIHAVSLSIQDITPLRQAQAGLEDLTERFRLATEAAGVGVWDWDIAGGKVIWDDHMFPLYGLPGGEREMPYEDWVQAVHPEDRDRAQADIEAALRGEPYDTHFRVIWPGGKLRFIKTYATVYFDADGKASRMIGVNWDATETFESQRHISDIAERLRLATQSAAIGVFEWNFADNSLIWDDIMHRIFGVAPADFTGDYAAWRSTLLAEDIEETERLLQEAVSETGQFDHIFRIQHPERGIRYIQATALLQRHPDGSPWRMIGVNWDITETKQVEEEIRRARDLAEEMLRLKSNFLANMSHEIRTPLNGILGVTSIMQEEEDLNQVRHMLDMLALSGRRLLATLTGILELAKIEAERDEYALEGILLSDMVHEVVEALRPLALQQGLDFRYTRHCSDGHVLADRRLLSQILSNIIGNALKFTNQGFVEVRVNCAVNFKGRRMLEIAVQDTGIGIDPQNIQKIFEPFKQESEGQARRFEGSGLGLSIAKKYTELLGGSIRVESQKGQGSTFFVYLPQTGDASP